MLGCEILWREFLTPQSFEPERFKPECFETRPGASSLIPERPFSENLNPCRSIREPKIGATNWVATQKISWSLLSVRSDGLTDSGESGGFPNFFKLPAHFPP